MRHVQISLGVLKWMHVRKCVLLLWMPCVLHLTSGGGVLCAGAHLKRAPGGALSIQRANALYTGGMEVDQAATVGRAFQDSWLMRYGLPTWLTSDTGTEFGGLFRHQLERLGVTHIHTSEP